MRIFMRIAQAAAETRGWVRAWRMGLGGGGGGGVRVGEGGG